MRPFIAAAFLYALPQLLSAQAADRTAEPVAPAKISHPSEPAHKRIFGIIPNYRTFPDSANYQPIRAKAKFKIATQDTFDPGTFVLAAAFAGYGQLKRSEPTYGNGMQAYAKYFGASFTDWAVGDYMTEALFPTMLHQDPRYFRKGTGSTISRFGHAAGQIFWTRTDGGGHMFNFSEIGGNAAGVALSQAYYPSSRSAGDAVGKLGLQVGLDMASNMMKEFWPDIANMLSRHKK